MTAVNLKFGENLDVATTCKFTSIKGTLLIEVVGNDCCVEINNPKLLYREIFHNVMGYSFQLQNIQFPTTITNSSELMTNPTIYIDSHSTLLIPTDKGDKLLKFQSKIIVDDVIKFTFLDSV